MNNVISLLLNLLLLPTPTRVIERFLYKIYNKQLSGKKWKGLS